MIVRETFSWPRQFADFVLPEVAWKRQNVDMRRNNMLSPTLAPYNAVTRSKQFVMGMA